MKDLNCTVFPNLSLMMSCAAVIETQRVFPAAGLKAWIRCRLDGGEVLVLRCYKHRPLTALEVWRTRPWPPVASVA